MLEEYHSLALLGKAGFGTLHMDGNTRLCTATAAAAMRESFGCDGQPGSYVDFVRLALSSSRSGPCEHLRAGSRADALCNRITATRSSWSGTTWRRRRPSSGPASSTASLARTLCVSRSLSHALAPLLRRPRADLRLPAALPHRRRPAPHVGRARRRRERRDPPPSARRDQPVPPQRHPQDPARQRRVPRQRLHLCVLLSRSTRHLSRSPLRPLTPLAPLAAKHTIGIDALRETVKDYPVERVAEITGVDAELIQRAAEKIGRSKRHVSTCLQGV